MGRACPERMLTVERARELFQGRWAGRVGFVLASGPGLTAEVVDRIAKVREARAIVVNDAWQRAPWAEILFTQDQRFVDRAQDVAGYAGLKVSAHLETTASPSEWGWVSIPGEHEFPQPRSFSFEFPLIHYGYNSGFGAMNLALHMGARALILAGFNMGQATDGTTHFYGKRTDGTASNYGEFINAFRNAAPGLVERGIRVLNATPGSHLDAFPVVTIEEAIEELCP